MSLKNPRRPGPASEALEFNSQLLPTISTLDLLTDMHHLSSPPPLHSGSLPSQLEETWGPEEAFPESDELDIILDSAELPAHGTGTQNTTELDQDHAVAQLETDVAAQPINPNREALVMPATEGFSFSAVNTPQLETPAPILFNDDMNASTNYFEAKKSSTDDHLDIADHGQSEVILELDVPVNDTLDFSSLWASQVDTTATVKQETTAAAAASIRQQFEQRASTAFASNPMACFNPLQVEGKTESNGNSLAKRRKALPKLYIPGQQQQLEEENNSNSDNVKVEETSSSNTVLDTPAVEKALNMGDENFDLLEWVTNTELPVNDPGFMALIGDSTDSPTVASVNNSLATVDVSAIGCLPSTSKAVPKGKKRVTVTWTSEEDNDETVSATNNLRHNTRSSRRGKNNANATPVANTDHAYIQPSTSKASFPVASTSKNDGADTSGLSSDDVKDVKEVKYRRMRDLNNIASKRCRQNRKRKFKDLLEEEDELKSKNAELRMKCANMEELVSNLKRQFIKKVSNPANNKKMEPIDLDQIMAQRLESM